MKTENYNWRIKNIIFKSIISLLHIICRNQEIFITYSFKCKMFHTWYDSIFFHFIFSSMWSSDFITHGYFFFSHSSLAQALFLSAFRLKYFPCKRRRLDSPGQSLMYHGGRCEDTGSRSKGETIPRRMEEHRYRPNLSQCLHANTWRSCNKEQNYANYHGCRRGHRRRSRPGSTSGVPAWCAR